MKKFGAQIVVYEDSGFLAETVARIYPLVDKILFLVGQAPWNGERNSQIAIKTISTISAMQDPAQKFIIVSKYWKTEAIQRNDGLDILRDADCDWCLIIDDDEMYNRAELSRAIDTVSRWICTNGEVGIWLAQHQIYWKNRDTIVEAFDGALAAFVSTNKDLVRFTDARCVALDNDSVWMRFPAEELIVHHMSYVRSDEQLWRKITTFSHAGEEDYNEWYKNIWLAWTGPMENLHPNHKAPWAFKRAVEATTSKFILEALPTSLELTDLPTDYLHNQTIKYMSHEADMELWCSGQVRFIDMFLLNQIDKNNKTMKILDVGCGDGVSLKYLKKLGYRNVSGLDLSVDKLSRALESGCGVMQSDAHSIDLPDHTFDLLYCSHTMEHCHSPQIVAAEFKRLGKSDAVFIVVLPYLDTGPEDAHCGSHIMGARIDDGGQSIVRWFESNGFIVNKFCFDNYREPEIWLSMNRRK